MVSNRAILIDNIDKIHTTEMGVDRIRRNLKSENVDVVEYCKDKIMDENCHIYRQGKNWYCEIDSVKITVNVYSYTIITAHIIKYIPIFREKVGNRCDSGTSAFPNIFL